MAFSPRYVGLMEPIDETVGLRMSAYERQHRASLLKHAELQLVMGHSIGVSSGNDNLADSPNSAGQTV